MHQQLQEIRDAVPSECSEATLDELEKLVSRYEAYLNEVSTSAYSCTHYFAGLKRIETALHSARFGIDETQRERAFYKAIYHLKDDMDDFMGQVPEKPDEAES